MAAADKDGQVGIQLLARLIAEVVQADTSDSLLGKQTTGDVQKPKTAEIR